MKKTLSVMLLIFLVLGCFSGCFFPTTPDSDDQDDGICLVGETVKNGDLEFTFTGVEIYTDNSYLVMDKVESGHEYVILKIEAKNIGDEDDHINMFYEDSYCDDLAIDPVSILFNYSGDTIWGDVAPGRIRKGYVAYEAPIGWEKIEFTYEPTFGDKTTFVAYNKNPTASNNSSNSNKGETTTQPSNEEATTQPKDETCLVGGSVTSHDLEFTFVGIEKYVDTSDWVLDKPEDGHEFVILKFKVKNVGEEEKYINMFYEDSYCDDVAIDPETILFHYTGNTIWGDVAAGKTREGYIAYELPIGWEKIEFTYDFSLNGGGKKLTFVGYSADVN